MSQNKKPHMLPNSDAVLTPSSWCFYKTVMESKQPWELLTCSSGLLYFFPLVQEFNSLEKNGNHISKKEKKIALESFWACLHGIQNDWITAKISQDMLLRWNEHRNLEFKTFKKIQKSKLVRYTIIKIMGANLILAWAINLWLMLLIIFRLLFLLKWEQRRSSKRRGLER